MDGSQRKYLASYMIDAWRRRQDDDLHAQVHRDPICESPEVTFQFAQSAQTHKFAFGKTPFNSDEADSMMNDKWHLYQVAHEGLLFPYTEAIPKYSKTADDEITADIMAKINTPTHVFNFPIVIKPNQGSLSKNVFIAENEDEIREAVKAVRGDFAHGDRMLIQQHLGEEVGAFTEIRAICLDGECVFAFEKNTENAARGDLANPIFWEGAKPVEVTDPDVLKRINDIAAYMQSRLDVNYGGFDLMLDDRKNVWVIEANSSPMGLEKVEREMENGPARIKDLTDRMIAKISHADDLGGDAHDQDKEGQEFEMG